MFFLEDSFFCLSSLILLNNETPVLTLSHKNIMFMNDPVNVFLNQSLDFMLCYDSFKIPNTEIVKLIH